MRVLCGDFAVEIVLAKCEGKRLSLKTFNGITLYTDDYYHENIALSALNDLVVDGYIRVNTLKEE